jgi:hypothetical protein
LPVQVLADVADDAYPPQQKSFAMLKWMADHAGTRCLQDWNLSFGSFLWLTVLNLCCMGCMGRISDN